MASKTSRSILDVVETAFANGLVGGIGIATGIIAARWLGPQGRGELAAIQMWPAILSSLAMVGMGEALAYYCAKRPSDTKRYIVTAGLITLTVMPAFAALGYVLLPHLLSQQSPRIVQAARVYLFLLPIYALVGLPYQLLRGIQRYRLWNAMRLVPSLLWLAVLITGVASSVLDPARMTAAYLVLLACAGPVLTGIVWRNAAGTATPTLATGRELATFGLPSVIGTLPQFFNLKLDQMMVTAVVAPQQLGVYMAAAAWGSAIPMLTTAISQVMSPRIAAGSSDAERNRRFNQGVRGAACVVAAAVIVLVAATPIGVTFAFGRAFQAAIVPAAILVVASGTNAINGVLEELLRGYGRPSATLRAESAALVVGVPAVLLLLPRLGLTGAAIGSLAGSATATVVLLFESRHAAALQMRDVFDTRAAAALITSARQRFVQLRVSRAVSRDF